MKVKSLKKVSLAQRKAAVKEWMKAYRDWGRLEKEMPKSDDTQNLNCPKTSKNTPRNDLKIKVE